MPVTIRISSEDRVIGTSIELPLLYAAQSFRIGMIECIDIVTVIRDLSTCTSTFGEHAVEGLRIPSVPRTSEGDSDDSNWLVHLKTVQ